MAERASIFDDLDDFRPENWAKKPTAEAAVHEVAPQDVPALPETGQGDDRPVPPPAPAPETRLPPTREPARQAPPSRDRIRDISESAGFQSRLDRRRTGRREQLNIRCTRRDYDRFMELCDAEGWVQGQTLEYALDALSEKLERQRGGR